MKILLLLVPNVTETAISVEMNQIKLRNLHQVMHNAFMFVYCFFLEAAFKLHFNFPSPDWKTVRGRFFMVNGLNISCACAKAPNGFSPFCHIGDGCLDVVLIRHTSLLNILRLLLRVSSKTRTMVIL